MDNSRIAMLPLELREQIYQDVFTYEHINITLNERGAPNDSLGYALPLTATCKELRQETVKFAAKLTFNETFHIVPNFQTTESGNDLISLPFDLPSWLKSATRHSKFYPKTVVLELGRIEAGNDSLGRYFDQDFDPILTGLPAAYQRPHVEFSVRVTLGLYALGDFDFTLRLNAPWQTSEPAARSTIVDKFAAIKPSLRSFVSAEWAGLSRGAVAQERCKLYFAVRVAEKEMLFLLTKAEERFRRNRPEPPSGTIWRKSDGAVLGTVQLGVAAATA